jgi:hypothetical protein
MFPTSITFISELGNTRVRRGEVFKKKGKRNAGRRLLQPAVQLARPLPLRGQLACRRSTAVLTDGLSPAARDFRPGFLGRGENADL